MLQIALAVDADTNVSKPVDYPFRYGSIAADTRTEPALA
jgi:hypothetical protein